MRVQSSEIVISCAMEHNNTVNRLHAENHCHVHHKLSHSLCAWWPVDYIHCPSFSATARRNQQAAMPTSCG
jgi:hypothetical protein